MTGPGPLRPPPSGRPLPRPGRSRRWIIAGLLSVVAIGLPATLLLLKRNDAYPTREGPADAFVRGLVTGSAVEGTAGKTGYTTAYELFSDRRKDALPFDLFFEEWARLVDSKGFIVDYVRTSEVRPQNGSTQPGEVKYVLYLGGDTQDHATLETVELRLNMVFNWRVGRFEVADYSLKHVPNPRATR
jgi:hypothetical protein